MGLDCSHNAWRGAYSAFNRLRQEVCRATGGSYPPHYIRNVDGTLATDKEGNVVYDRTIEPDFWQFGPGYTTDSHPGLTEFLKHSDCDGEIAPDMCIVVADELETLLPKIIDWPDGGHIGARGGFKAVVAKFIIGCRAAASAGEPLSFH